MLIYLIIVKTKFTPPVFPNTIFLHICHLHTCTCTCTSNDVAVVTLKWVWFAQKYSTDITHKKFEDKEEEIH